MNPTPLQVSPELEHPWDLRPLDAMALQRRLRLLLEETPLENPPQVVAGCDASYDAPTGQAFAAVVLFELPSMREMERSVVQAPINYPYVPGLLSFREAPVLLQAMARIKRRPELLMFDAHGLAHPREMGLASHLGLLLDIPSIGCAKSPLVGTYDEPGLNRGDCAPLWLRGQVVGCVVRTRDKVKPVFVSVGHKIDLPQAIELVLSCCRGRKLPEPTRLADRIVGHARRSYKSSL